MRVNSVSMVYCRRPLKNNGGEKPLAKKQAVLDSPKESVNFKGKFGEIVGGVIGTGAVVAASCTVAPVLICLTAAGMVAGAIAGGSAEDAINGKDDKK